MTTQAQAVELTRRYQRLLRNATTATAAALAKLWDDLGSWNEDDLDTFTQRSTPLTTGAQRTATALTVGYLGLLLGTQVAAVNADRFADKLDTLTPFLAYWSGLKNGMPWVEAITAGRTTAGAIGNTAVQSAARGAASEVDQAEERIQGWERVLVGPSCEFCATVATQRYHSAESADFGHGHGGVDYCDCTIVPIIGKTAPGRVINRPLLDALKNADESSAYMNPDGSPASRPDAAPVEVP